MAPQGCAPAVRRAAVEAGVEVAANVAQGGGG